MHRRNRPGRRPRLGAALGTVLLVAMAAALLLAGIQVRSGGWQVAPVLSGSMRPGFAVGGVVIAQRVPVSGLKVRDVVLIRRPDDPSQRVVHRIVALQPGPSGPVIQTQGDANPVRDPWKVSLRDDSTYRVRWSVPLVGYPALWLHQPDTRRHVLVVAGLLALVAVAVAVLPYPRAPKAPVGRHAAPDDDAADDVDPPVKSPPDVLPVG